MQADDAIYWLAPTTHVAAIGDDLVILDLACETYLCLPGGVVEATPAADRRSLLVRDPSVAEDLKGAGLLGPSTTSGPPWRAPVAPATSALTDQIERPSWRDPANAAPILLDVLRFYWRRPLREVIACVPREEADVLRRRATPDLLSVVANFHRWSPFAPTSSKCLLRSFMLLRLLRRHGHDAQWIFGVTTWPFLAHCWLQCDDVVLDDEVEALAAFEPILVV